MKDTDISSFFSVTWILTPKDSENSPSYILALMMHVLWSSVLWVLLACAQFGIIEQHIIFVYANNRTQWASWNVLCTWDEASDLEEWRSFALSWEVRFSMWGQKQSPKWLKLLHITFWRVCTTNNNCVLINWFLFSGFYSWKELVMHSFFFTTKHLGVQVICKEFFICAHISCVALASDPIDFSKSL